MSLTENTPHLCRRTDVQMLFRLLLHTINYCITTGVRCCICIYPVSARCVVIPQLGMDIRVHKSHAFFLFIKVPPLGTWEFINKNTMKHRKYFTVVCVVIILFAIKNYVNGQNINVCYNSSKEVTLQSSDARWIYVWEKKNALASVWNLVGNGISVNIEYITQNIDVRCSADTNSDGVGDSIVYQIQLVPYPELVAANISEGGFICHGSVSPNLYITDLAAGGGDSYSYQWMYSDNGENLWVNIPNAVQTSFSGQILTSTRYYRLQTTSTMGCGTKYSNITQVTVHNPLVAPSIGTSVSTICYNSSPSPLVIESVAQGGSGEFSLQWQKEENGVFVNVEGATSGTYQPPALRTATAYRITATNECGAISSSSLTINVYPMLISGSIESEKTICHNSSTTIEFVNDPTGGGEQYTYQWQSSLDGLVWNDETTATQEYFTTPNMTFTKYYRCVVTSALGCSSDTTNVCVVNVLNPFVAGTISHDTTICYSTSPGVLTMNTNAVGGMEPYSYQWQVSTDNVNYSNIINANNTSYEPNNLTQTQYYRLQFTSSLGCGTLQSNPITINVYDDLVSPIISSNTKTTICYDSIPQELFILTNPTGGNGEFTHQWQVRNGNDWTDINGAIAPEYQPQNLIDTLSYRLISTSTYGCGEVISEPYTINVYPIIQAGTISGISPICYNTDVSLSFSTMPQGGGNSYIYQWQQSEDDNNWNNISMSNISTYTTPELVATTNYRLIVKSALGCSEDTTNTVQIAVLNPFVSGNINGDTTICYNTTPGLLVMTSNASGGMEPYSYQWQVSTDNVNFTDITDANDTDYLSSNLTQSHYYRLQFTSSLGCGTSYSNTMSVNVYEDLTNPVISSNTQTTICYDSIPQELFILTNPTGGNGIFTHQWQVRNGNDWTDINGAIAPEYQPQNLIDTLSYRLISTSTYGCGEVISEPYTINVYPIIQAGTISGISPICYNTDVSLSFSTMPQGGGNSYIYQWQQSEDDNNWNNISMSNISTYTTPELVATTNYRLIVKSALGCSEDTTNTVQIAVLNPFVSGNINGDTTICYNTTPGLLVMTSNASGGMEPYSYQWQVSTDNVNFTDITDANDTDYLSSNLTQSHYYRLQFTSSLGCGTSYSNTMSVNVYEDLTNPVISSNTQTTICYDSIPQELFILTNPTGGNGIFTHQWQVRNGNDWTDINGAIAPEYQPQNLIDTISYRLVSTSTYGCGSVVSAPYTINVYPIIQAGVISGVTPICYNTESQISFTTMPQGGGNSYTYHWQISSDDIVFNDVPYTNIASYNTGNINDTTFYRVIVSSNYGCSQDTTNSYAIAVRPEFVAGTIETHLDSACYGEKPSYQIDLIIPCVGGAEPYSYQWVMGTDTNNMSIAPYGNTIYYQPDTIYDTTYYKLIFTSSDNCGVVESNIHTIKMNPLPIPHHIEGVDTVCYAQYETYTLPTASNDYSYSWITENDNGDITSFSPTNDSVEIYWKNSQTLDQIIVEVTDNITGCKSNNYKQVYTRSDSAPSRTIVIRKPNSNILICEEENPALYYQWGYTVKATGEEVVIENSNRRYVLLPHEFDSITYSYWVELLPQKSSYCYSRSYYNPLNDSQIEEPSSSKVIVPSIANSVVPITINNTDIMAETTCQYLKQKGEAVSLALVILII